MTLDKYYVFLSIMFLFCNGKRFTLKRIILMSLGSALLLPKAPPCEIVDGTGE